MGFMNRHTKTETLDVTAHADPDGNEYWIKLRPLSGEEWEQADAAQTEVRAQMSQEAGTMARAELRRRKARRAAGLPPEEGEESGALQTLIRIDTPAYRAFVIDHALAGWNLTDEYDRPLPLDREDAAARAASIRILPDEVRDLIVDWAEARRQRELDPGEEAAFPGRLPVGGQDRPLGSPADPGAVAAGDLVDAYWAEDRAGVGDLHAA